MSEEDSKKLVGGRISTVIVGMINVGMVLILIGLWFIDFSGVAKIDAGGYQITILLFATISLIFAIYAIMERYLTAGMFFIITFLTAMILVIIKNSDTSLLNSLIYVALGYAMCAVIFFHRDEMVFSVASALVAFSLFTFCIEGFVATLGTVLMVIAGVLVLVSGGLSLASIGPSILRAKIVTVPLTTNIDYPTTVTYTAGTFLSCIVLFTLTMNGKTDSLLTFKLLVASMSVFAGIYGIVYGSHKRGIDLIVLAIYSIEGAISGIYGIGGLSYLNIIFAVPLLSSAVLEYRSKEPIKCLCTLLFAATIITGSLSISSEAFSFVIILTKIVATYDSLSTWYIFETGSAPRITRFNKGAVRFDE